MYSRPISCPNSSHPSTYALHLPNTIYFLLLFVGQPVPVCNFLRQLHFPRVLPKTRHAREVACDHRLTRRCRLNFPTALFLPCLFIVSFSYMRCVCVCMCGCGGVFAYSAPPCVPQPGAVRWWMISVVPP